MVFSRQAFLEIGGFDETQLRRHDTELFSRVAYLSDFQKKILEQLKDRVGPEEQEALAPFIDACSQRCGRMCEMMGCGRARGGTSQDGWICTCPTCN